MKPGAALAGQTSSTKSVQIGKGTATVLLAMVTPRVRLLVLGAGLDAEPVTRLAGELGWRVTVVDHRPAYIDNGHFDEAEEVICCAVEDMSGQVEPSGFDAAIVMSHHLASDRQYLAQLSKSEVSYIGLLGPKDRRRRLLEELGDDASALGRTACMVPLVWILVPLVRRLSPCRSWRRSTDCFPGVSSTVGRQSRAEIHR